MSVFQTNLGGPDGFTPIDNTARGRGVNMLHKRASEPGDVLQVSFPFGTDAQVDLIGAGADNSTNGFLGVSNAKENVPSDISAPIVTAGNCRLKMRRNDALIVPEGTPLYCTEGEVWATPVSGAGASTSGRLFASISADVPAGGAPGDIIIVEATMRGVPPHLG